MPEKFRIPTPVSYLTSCVAWTTHLYTATGAVFALLALHAFVAGTPREGFLWLYAAVVVDATDGWLARLVKVDQRLPSVDGVLLDSIIDYVTFVFVPAYFVYAILLVPPGWNGLLASAMILSSAYGFSHRNAKTADYFFRGFPSYWNIVVFYLYAASLPPSITAGVLLALVVMVFIPVNYVYPSRTPALRRLTIFLGLVWAALMLFSIWQLPEVRRWLLVTTLFFPAYYVLLSFILYRRRLD